MIPSVNECFFIKVRSDNVEAKAKLKALLGILGGKTLMEAQSSLLVSLPINTKTVLESLPYIEALNGVYIQPRKITWIKVSETSDGRRIHRYTVKDNQIIKIHE